MANPWDQEPSGDPFGDSNEQRDGIELIDLTGVDEVKLEHPERVNLPVNRSLRNYKLEGDHRPIKQVAVQGSNYHVGDFVELRELIGVHKFQFIEIKSINAHIETDDVVIRGLPYARARNLRGCLPKKWNEVCLILEVDADDARPDEQQALFQIEPEQILKKRILTNTNRPFPDCRFDHIVYVTDKQKEEMAPLACRWKMRALYKDASQRRAGRLQGQALEHLTERDPNIKKRNLGVDKDRSHSWRSGSIDIRLVPKPGSTDQTRDDSPEPKYSFADISGGAGGASRGAQMAGLDVVLATEPCIHAIHSYRANFPNTRAYHIDTTKPLANKKQYTVDVLHISPSALDTAGDDAEAASESCTELLKKFRPRLVLMEHPSTMTSEKNTPLFNKIILSFTDTGYSTRWENLNMVNYGLPQMRKRIIMVAAGPGERFPLWPAVTHSSDPTEDQKPFVTERDAISVLNPQLHSLHDPDALPALNRAVVRDADEPIPVIGSSGAAYHHPDGERDFTLRELASFQGFPTYHEFKGAYVKKQIGTAFPPLVAMTFYRHFRQHMEEIDGLHSDPIEPSEIAEPSDMAGPSDTPAGSRPDNANEAGNPRLPETPNASVTLEPVILTPSPPLTSTPESGGALLLLPTPPPTQQQIPTPSSSGGRFIAGRRAAALRLRRERAMFEEAENEGGPETLQTPSKRARTSNDSEVSRTVSGSSDAENDVSNDATMYYDSELDDVFRVVDQDLQSSGRRSESCDGEV